MFIFRMMRVSIRIMTKQRFFNHRCLSYAIRSVEPASVVGYSCQRRGWQSHRPGTFSKRMPVKTDVVSRSICDEFDLQSAVDIYNIRISGGENFCKRNFADIHACQYRSISAVWHTRWACGQGRRTCHLWFMRKDNNNRATNLI